MNVDLWMIIYLRVFLDYFDILFKRIFILVRLIRIWDVVMWLLFMWYWGWGCLNLWEICCWCCYDVWGKWILSKERYERNGWIRDWVSKCNYVIDFFFLNIEMIVEIVYCMR